MSRKCPFAAGGMKGATLAGFAGSITRCRESAFRGAAGVAKVPFAAADPTLSRGVEDWGLQGPHGGIVLGRVGDHAGDVGQG